MAKGAYIGVNGVARKIKKGYVGITEATNLVTNGSFESMDGWTAWGANVQDSSQHRFGSNSLKLTGDELVNRTVPTPIVGHKYYGREYIKTDGDIQPSDCRFEVHAGDGVGLNWVYGWNRGNFPDWTMISAVHAVDAVNADSYVLRTFAIGVTTGAIWLDGIMLIDLTETYGAGKEPSKEWCDANIPFFEGSMAVPNPFSSGKARKIKKAYIGIGGVARPCWSGGELAYYGTLDVFYATRRHLAATSNGNYAIFAGGDRGTSARVDTVDAYNSTLTHEVPTGLSIGRTQLASATIGDYAVFAGGYTKDGRTATVDYYDNSLTRGTAENLSPSRYDLPGTTTGDYALFGGGYASTSSGSTNVDAYNKSLTKTIPTALSTARYRLAATTVGDYALFGGGTPLTSKVDAYDKSLTRTTPTGLDKARGYLAATTVGDYALFGGGYTNVASNIVDAYDTSLTRTNPTSLYVARLYLAATTVGNYALFAGGASSTGNPTIYNLVDVYDTSLTRISETSTRISKTRYSLAATTIGDYALFGGGQTDTNTYDPTVDAYTIA